MNLINAFALITICAAKVTCLVAEQHFTNENVPVARANISSQRVIFRTSSIHTVSTSFLILTKCVKKVKKRSHRRLLFNLDAFTSFHL